MEFNSVHQKVKFTIDKEVCNTLNYLDPTITNKHNQLTFGIYLKTTTTDLIIHNDSCHPYEYKKSAINYLFTSICTVYRLEMQLSFCLSLFLSLSLSRYMFRQ
jgi:hypothetical protein